MNGLKLERSDSKIFVKVIMACHNRAAKTNRFFESFTNATRRGFEFEFLVTNDGSTDETDQILRAQPFPIRIHNGSGDLFWAHSMAKAEQLIERVPDAILWVNDDLVLNPDAFEKLLDSINAYPHSVHVGQVADVDSGKCIYGGYRRVGLHPLVLDLINPELSDKQADTFNGNFVYIPIEIRIGVGPIDGFFAHGYADCDYGYRVKSSGYHINIIPGFIGKTEDNIPFWPKKRLGKFKQLVGKKHNPIKSQFRFFLRHSKHFGFLMIPIYLARPFLRVLILNTGHSIKTGHS
jgi:GT2 family glycosyltransferase